MGLSLFYIFIICHAIHGKWWEWENKDIELIYV